MGETVTTYWSRDEENYSCDSLQELLSTHDDLEDGDVVYFGEGNPPDPGMWICAEDVIEQLACRADDECGEFAEDYPDVSPDAQKELDDLLETWARKHCQPTFYVIRNAKEYVITAEDIAEANK